MTALLALCSIDGCDNRIEARGWCNRHYLRWRRYGDPLGRRSLSTSYDALHKRLRSQRGAASAHPCIVAECEAPATAWAWQRTGPSRSGTLSGASVTWGTDLADYEAMCSSHHSRLDHGGDLDTYACGHPRTPENTLGRWCRECWNARARARYANDPEYRARYLASQRARQRRTRAIEAPA